jgi:tetratricopeptide (TPR) repeat protein
LNPKIDEFYINRGNVYKNFGQYQLALQDFEQAIQLNHENSRTYNSRGIILKNLGQISAFINRGIGHISLGNYAQACEDFRKACDLGDCTYLTWAKNNDDCP